MSASTSLEVGIRTPSEGSNVSLYEGSTVTLSKGFIDSPSEVGVGILGSIWCFVGKIPGVFACMTRWCVCGASRIWDGYVGVVDVCFVLVVVGAMFSIVVLKMVVIWCNTFLCRPWKVWFYFLIFLIARIRVVAICVASSIGVSVGMVKCCG